MSVPRNYFRHWNPMSLRRKQNKEQWRQRSTKKNRLFQRPFT